MEYAPVDSSNNIVLVANKTDMPHEKREVTLEDAVKVAKELQLAGVVETSAKDGLESVDDGFYITILNAFEKRK